MREPVAFLALETAVPAGKLTRDRFVEFAARLELATTRQRAILGKVAMQSGILARYSSLAATDATASDVALPFYSDSETPPTTQARMARYEQDAPALAREAAAKALASSRMRPKDITHLVTFSCTGFSAPGWDVGLIDALPLRSTVPRVHVGYMGCHGANNALRVACALASSDPTARVLMVGVELCSLHYQPGMERDAVLPNALFGDGAAAMILSAGGGGLGQVLATGSQVIPNSADAMTWRIGESGFRMTLDSRVPDLIRDHLGGAMRDFLAAARCGLSDVAAWAIHPGGPRIIEACLEGLGCDDRHGELSRRVMRDFGNMSSVTILFVLRAMLEEGTLGRIASATFGPGLTAEFGLFLVEKKSELPSAVDRRNL